MTTPVTDPVVSRAPTREFYMQCRENHVEDDYEGGLVLLAAIRAGTSLTDFIDVRLVASAANDRVMFDYPVTRDDKRQRFFRVTVEEVDYTELPPDPNAPKAATAFELLVQARDAALRDGDLPLADHLTARLNAGVTVEPATPAPPAQ